jgi:hypothetical protein
MSNSIGLGNEIQVVDEEGDKRWALHFNEDATISLERFNASGVSQETVATIDASGDVTLTGALTAASIATGDGEVSYRALENDVVPTITRADAGGVIELLNSTTGAKAILTDTAGADAVVLGMEVTIFLTAAAGNSYTLALSTGTLTFNAALECAKIVRTSLGWNVVSLNGATIV